MFKPSRWPRLLFVPLVLATATVPHISCVAPVQDGAGEAVDACLCPVEGSPEEFEICACPQPVPGDLTGDGVVNFVDIFGGLTIAISEQLIRNGIYDALGASSLGSLGT